MPRIAIVVGNYPDAEFARRRDRIVAFSADDIDVGVIRIAPSAYAKGFDGDEAQAFVPQFVEGFRQAESEGYDAVSPLGVLDIGIDAGRSAVSIPVVGALEASLHVAALLGRRAGLIVYSENLVATVERLAHHYRLATVVAGYGHVGTDLTELAASKARLHDAFVSAARALVDAHDADVIVSAGISLCPIHLDRSALEADLGLPVVEPIGAPVQVAASLARMRMGHSRKRWPLIERSTLRR
jgi:Asp/Glu/hydantoin racemase